MDSLNENYLQIMIQSLQKKVEVLDAIIKKNQEQNDGLRDPQLDVDDFEKTVAEKAKLIEQLTFLDSGFERLFEKVKEELNENREQHKEEIITLQGLIKKIMEKSNEVQTQEIRNKDLAALKFSNVRKQVKEIRSGYKVVDQYYKNMMKLNYVDSQFLDKKK